MNETMIILGAGASKDYGYPTGYRLTEKIRNVNLNKEIYEDLSKEDAYYGRKNNYEQGIKLIKNHFFKSRSLSIDSWLAKPENQECVNAGKFLISYFISNCERKGFTNDGFFQPLIGNKDKKDWYSLLIKAITTDSFEDFGPKNKKLTIITFNYDRSLEYYLINSFKNTYIGYEEQKYREQLKLIDIIHPYGNVGNLPFFNSKEFFRYQNPQNTREIINRSKNLKIIPELRNKENSITSKIKKKLTKAKNIFFIGFSYDKLNLEILGFPFKSTLNSVNLVGTTYGMENGEIAVAKSHVRINTDNMDDIVLHDDSCDAHTFFRRYMVQVFS